MKKVLFVAILSIAFISSAFAYKVSPVSSRAIRNFEIEFSGATNVQWSTYQNCAWASFMLNNKEVRAFFDTEGRLVGTGTVITLNDVPTASKRSFAKRYSSVDVTEVMQFDTDGETVYFVSATTANKSMIFKLERAGVSVVKTSDK